MNVLRSTSAFGVASTQRPARGGAVHAVGPWDKGALHHQNSRPIKYTPADKRHRGATYPPLPPPPPEFTITGKKAKAPKAEEQ